MEIQGKIKSIQIDDSYGDELSRAILTIEEEIIYGDYQHNTMSIKTEYSVLVDVAQDIYLMTAVLQNFDSLHQLKRGDNILVSGAAYCVPRKDRTVIELYATSITLLTK